MLEAIMKNEKAVEANKFAAFMRHAMAAGGMTLGMMALLSALLVWATSAIERQNHDRLELILIVGGFAFLGIGAHGLDLVHRAKREKQKRKFNL